MNRRNKCVFLLFYLFSLTKLGESVKCYSCSSTQDNMCGDDFNLRYFKVYECAGSCVKTRGRDSNNRLEINRFCGRLDDDTCRSSVYNNINVDMCWCNVDFCNPATKPLPNRGAFIIFSLLTFLIVYFCPF